MRNVKDERVMIACWSHWNKEKGWPKTKDQCEKSSKTGEIEFRKTARGEIVMFDLVFGFVYREDDFNQEISKIENVVLPQYEEMISGALIKASGG